MSSRSETLKKVGLGLGILAVGLINYGAFSNFVHTLPYPTQDIQATVRVIDIVTAIFAAALMADRQKNAG